VEGADVGGADVEGADVEGWGRNHVDDVLAQCARSISLTLESELAYVVVGGIWDIVIDLTTVIQINTILPFWIHKRGKLQHWMSTFGE